MSNETFLDPVAWVEEQDDATLADAFWAEEELDDATWQAVHDELVRRGII